MPIEDLAPCSGAHAVQSAVFAIEWLNPLPQEALSEVRATYDKGESLKRQFPETPQEQKLLSVRIDQASGAATLPTVASGGACVGYKFSKTAGPSPSRTLQITRENCLYIVQDYTRWKPVLTDVLLAFSEIAESLVKSPVAAIGLQYTDVFHWRAAPEELNFSEVLSESSGLIPTSALARKDLWHSHHGYFVDSVEPTPHKLLENLNVDIVDNGGQRSVAIVTSHQARLTKPIYNSADLKTYLDSFYECLHNRNKALLSQILTDGVKRKIKLQGGTLQ